MNALKPIKKVNIHLKKIVEKLQEQNINAQICTRSEFLRKNWKDCANNS